jgi:membrane protein required for colicin V production
VNGLDILFVVIIAVCAIFSIIKGFMREVFFLGGVVLGIILAANFYLDIAESLSPVLGTGTVAKVVSFALIFLVIAVGVSLAGVALARIMRIAKLGGVDRLLGLLFGVIKGVLICAVICFVIVTFVPRGGELLQASTMSPTLLIIIDQVTFLFPQELQEEFAERLEVVRELWRLRRLPGGQVPPREMQPDEARDSLSLGPYRLVCLVSPTLPPWPARARRNDWRS